MATTDIKTESTQTMQIPLYDPDTGAVTAPAAYGRYAIHDILENTSVATIADLAALTFDEAPSVIYVRGDSAEGDGGEDIFVRNTADLSDEVTADPLQNTYVPPNEDVTGASGAWIRQIAKKYQVQVATIVDLQALPVGKYSSAYVRGYAAESDGGEGNFVWVDGDYSTEVTADTYQSKYVSSSPTSGAWVREFSGAVKTSWICNETDDCTDRVNALLTLYNNVENNLDLRIDGTISVSNYKSFDNRHGSLTRFSASSSSTVPVLNVHGNYARFYGGKIKSENGSPDGIVTLGHPDTSVTYNSLLWSFVDVEVWGVKLAGNVGIKIVSADPYYAGYASNYFGNVRDIKINGADIGIQLLEEANAHQISNVHFWNIKTAAYQLRGAYANTILGGFVHTGTDGVIGIQLLDKTIGAHHSIGNYFYGVGIEPGGSTSKSIYIDTNCTGNSIDVYGNVAGGKTVLNTYNNINEGFGARYLKTNQTIISGPLSSTQITSPIIYSDRFAKVVNKDTLPEHVTETIATISVPANSTVLLSIRIAAHNSSLGRTSVYDLIYQGTNPSGTGTVLALIDSKTGSTSQAITAMSISGANIQATTYNNGTSTTTYYSIESEMLLSSATADISTIVSFP